MSDFREKYLEWILGGKDGPRPGSPGSRLGVPVGDPVVGPGGPTDLVPYQPHNVVPVGGAGPAVTPEVLPPEVGGLPMGGGALPMGGGQVPMGGQPVPALRGAGGELVPPSPYIPWEGMGAAAAKKIPFLGAAAGAAAAHLAFPPLAGEGEDAIVEKMLKQPDLETVVVKPHPAQGGTPVSTEAGMPETTPQKAKGYQPSSKVIKSIQDLKDAATNGTSVFSQPKGGGAEDPMDARVNAREALRESERKKMGMPKREAPASLEELRVLQRLQMRKR